MHVHGFFPSICCNDDDDDDDEYKGTSLGSGNMLPDL